MSAIETIKADMTRKLGPLPVYGWVGVGAMGFVLYRVIRSHGAASTNAATGGIPQGGTAAGGNGSGAGAGGGGSSFSPYAPISLPGGSSVYDPSTGKTSTAPTVNPNDFLGGSVSDFVKTLGPNYNSFSFADNGLSIGTTNSAQNVIDAQNYQSGLQAQNSWRQQAYDFLRGSWQDRYAYQVALAGLGYGPGGSSAPPSTLPTAQQPIQPVKPYAPNTVPSISPIGR